MKLPYADQLVIPKSKVAQYLLSSTHRTGKGKAEFFISHGFTAEVWEGLADALRQHVNEQVVTVAENTSFGTRYVIEGPLVSPNGRQLQVRTVWFIDEGGQSPRFVTAYPLKRRTP